ncbi:uncharacterized protein ARMOST_22544 [Armillaria ostoyae]|uniref:Uncharacterized protein n=1 Tax=Armillaria ostoyae TaxID=47428 RepID=A0A284SD68_ARMOS|nr:uncharacterized protein ARMOST_22544 [Armillaria ostoyae]
MPEITYQTVRKRYQNDLDGWMFLVYIGHADSAELKRRPLTPSYDYILQCLLRSVNNSIVLSKNECSGNTFGCVLFHPEEGEAKRMDLPSLEVLVKTMCLSPSPSKAEIERRSGIRDKYNIIVEDLMVWDSVNPSNDHIQHQSILPQRAERL